MFRKNPCKVTKWIKDNIHEFTIEGLKTGTGVMKIRDVPIAEVSLKLSTSSPIAGIVQQMPRAFIWLKPGVFGAVKDPRKVVTFIKHYVEADSREFIQNEIDRERESFMEEFDRVTKSKPVQ